MNQAPIHACSSGGKNSEYAVWKGLFGKEYASEAECRSDFLLYSKYRRAIRSEKKHLSFDKKTLAKCVFPFAWFKICGRGGEERAIRDFIWFCSRNAPFQREISRMAYRSNPGKYARLAKEIRKRRTDLQKDLAKKYAREYARKKAKTDPIWRARKVMRTRIGAAIIRGGGVKSQKTMQLVGCDVQSLRLHLEKQFKPGMTWENYGKFGWHIDHIKPCSAFDLTDPAQAEECFHFTNLQPLWAFENLSKGGRF